MIVNTGTFDIQGNNTIDLGDASSPQLMNSGTLRKSTNAGTAIIDVHFINNGTMETSSGVLDLRRTSTLGGVVTGSATVVCSAGTHILDDVLIGGVGGVRLTSGAMSTLGAGATVAPGGRLHVAGGTLSGSAPLTVHGTLDWTGGTISGSGALTVDGWLNFGPGGDVFLDGRTLTNVGTTTSFLTPEVVPHLAKPGGGMDSGAQLPHDVGPQ